MATQLDFVTLDVFTTEIFEGNPLGVVFLPPPTSPQLTQRQKQTIAREFNLSETIFVHDKSSSPSGSRAIDIFTESVELPFAGHPTIGAASWFLCHAAEKDSNGNAAVQNLLMKAGKVPISLQDPQTGTVTAHVAHNVHIHETQYPLSEVSRLYPSLRAYLKPEKIALFSVVKGMSQLLIELPSLEALGAVTTAYGGQEASASYLDEGWAEGMVCTYFFVRDVEDEKLGRKVIRTRTILGNLEDPATGSAASGLAAYLSLREGRAGEFKYDVVQGVEMGRRSEIGVEVAVREGSKIGNLVLKGSAVKVSEGKIVVPQA
jgi:PhzF family phenazine biosynthesis protein